MKLELDLLRKENEEVYYADLDFISLDQENINFLIGLAKNTVRQRVRLCCHKSPQDIVHEMIIVHPRYAYVRPHMHLNKAESMIVLKGEVDYITFKEKGTIDQVISMGESRGNKPFYQSIRSESFHSLLIKSEWLVFLEITNGPFIKEDTVYADWSKQNPDEKEILDFIEFLKEGSR